MCGICGIVRFDGVTDGDREHVQRMTQALRHRGPDGDGFWSDDRVAFGHARLAIIDLMGGHQPMWNERQDVAIIFNGEIYNYRELRKQLVSAGHAFRTESDTEVVVHGYEEWGDEVVTRLRGMFAFALWDSSRSRVVIARDRLGEKPFYYYTPPGQDAVYFASEMKAVVAHPEVPRALNAPRLREYLTFRSVSGDETLFANLRQVEPGMVMVLEPGRRTIRSYWDASQKVEIPSTHDALVGEGERLLSDAIECRLVSDVAVGTITSGGLDSSLVTAMAIRLAGRPLDTFCVGFGSEGTDERPYARQVAKHVGSRHHDIEVSGDDVQRELERLTWAHDEPLTHPNSIPMHLIFRYAKETSGVTVVLSGEGADELFGGYGWYDTMRKREALRRLPLVGRLLGILPGRRGSVARKVLAPDYPYRANSVLGEPLVDALLGSHGDAIEWRRRFWPDGEPTGLDALFRYDQRVYLEPLLQRQDRMSMAAGVEARVVFLDHTFVRWANSVPARAKVAAGSRKQLLKEIAARWLPQTIINREKVGFEVPLGAWFRDRGPLAGELDRVRDADAFVRTVLHPGAIDRLLREHQKGIADHGDALWSVLSLEVWADVFLGPNLRSCQLPGAATGNPAVLASLSR